MSTQSRCRLDFLLVKSARACAFAASWPVFPVFPGRGEAVEKLGPMALQTATPQRACGFSKDGRFSQGPWKGAGAVYYPCPESGYGQFCLQLEAQGVGGWCAHGSFFVNAR